MGAGPSAEQKQAAAADAQLSAQEAQTAAQQNQRETDQYNAVKPYYQNLMTNGLSYMPLLQDSQSGLVARAYAPAYQQLNQQYGQYQNLPSGAYASAKTSLAAQQARDFDSQMLSGLQQNEAAKQAGAAGLAGQQQIAVTDALGNTNAANSANNSIMQAPLASAGLGGVLGGVVGSLGSAAINKIPF